MIYTTLKNLKYDLKTNNSRTYKPVNNKIKTFIYCQSEDNWSPFNTLAHPNYLYLIDILNSGEEVSVWLNKVSGTTTDYIIVKNKCFSGIREMKKWLSDLGIKSSMKYQVYDYNTGEELEYKLTYDVVQLHPYYKGDFDLDEDSYELDGVDIKVLGSIKYLTDDLKQELYESIHEEIEKGIVLVLSKGENGYLGCEHRVEFLYDDEGEKTDDIWEDCCEYDIRVYASVATGVDLV